MAKSSSHKQARESLFRAPTSTHGRRHGCRILPRLRGESNRRARLFTAENKGFERRKQNHFSPCTPPLEDVDITSGDQDSYSRRPIRFRYTPEARSSPCSP